MPTRPADSAALVLIRAGSRGEDEVLLGRRHQKSHFMPSVYVFPGGRLAPGDRHPSGFPEPAPEPAPQGADKQTATALIRYRRAALRETFEETGLLLADSDRGTAGPAQTDQVVWQAYRRAGVVPAFGALKLIARAITPGFSPTRFHNRFFLADGALASGTLGGDGELDDLAWVPVSQALTMKMARVGYRVLHEAMAHRQDPGQDTAALFRWIGPKSGGGLVRSVPGSATAQAT